jgi:hypothetical protein
MSTAIRLPIWMAISMGVLFLAQSMGLNTSWAYITGFAAAWFASLLDDLLSLALS